MPTNQPKITLRGHRERDAAASHSRSLRASTLCTGITARARRMCSGVIPTGEASTSADTGRAAAQQTAIGTPNE